MFHNLISLFHCVVFVFHNTAPAPPLGVGVWVFVGVGVGHTIGYVIYEYVFVPLGG